MKISIPFLTFFSLLGALCWGQQEQDSIQILEEIILLEGYVDDLAIGITPSDEMKLGDLQQYSPVDFASGLNQITGLYVLSGALNTNRITIRGVGARTPFGTDKLRLYYNGIPVTNGAGVSTIEAYDFENMGRMEVVKGPKGTTLGANLGGAIALTTRPPEVGKTFLRNVFTTGSYDLIKNNLAFRHSTPKFNLNLSYNHLSTNGFRQNNQFNRDGLLLNSSVRTGEQGKLSFLVNYIDYDAGIPSSITSADFREDPRRAAANWLAARGFERNQYTLTGVSYAHEFNPGWESTLSVFYTYLDHYEPRPFNILDEYTQGFGFRSLTRGRLGRGELHFGAELYKDEYNWQTYVNQFRDNDGNGSLQGALLSDNQEYRSQLNLFGVWSYPLSETLKAQLGLSFNDTRFDFRDQFTGDGEDSSAERDFAPILLPSLGLELDLPKGQLYGNISRGFSNPGLEEALTPDGALNPEIEQEKGWNYELGYRGKALKNHLGILFSLYQMNIKDLLVAERFSEDQFIGRNAGSTRHRGAELDLSYRASLGGRWLLLPRLGYSYSNHQFVDFVDEEEDFSGNDLAGVPVHRFNTGIRLMYGTEWTLAVNHQYVDEIPLNDGNTLYSEAFHVFSLTSRFNTKLSDHLRLGVHAGINNLFDLNYAQSVLVNAVGFGGNAPRYFYPGNDRNYFGGLALSYQF